MAETAPAESNKALKDLSFSIGYDTKTVEDVITSNDKINTIKDFKETFSEFSDKTQEWKTCSGVGKILLILDACDEKGQALEKGVKTYLTDDMEQTASEEKKLDVKTSLQTVTKFSTQAVVAFRESSQKIREQFKDVDLEDTLQARDLEEFSRDQLSLLEDQFLRLNTAKKSLDKLVEKHQWFDDHGLSIDHFLSCVSVALYNDTLDDTGGNYSRVIENVDKACQEINTTIYKKINNIIHDSEFQSLEANWIGLRNLIDSADWSANIMIDILDCTKEELREDFENHDMDLTNSDLMKKVYVAEYDQYGGNPYGCMIGLFEFDSSENDRRWLRTMSKVAAASHAPFISSVGPKFFGCNNIQELSEINDISDHMSKPQYEKWQEFRDEDDAAYIGLTVPKFMLRPPYHPVTNHAGIGINFVEKIKSSNQGKDFLWCNAAYLFAKNILNSFAESGWCQYLRGPKGGGLIEHLPRYIFEKMGQDEIKPPVEMVIPDHRELQFANEGFIPLVYKKGSSEACFFSCQSVKKSKKWKDPKDSENSQLVTNLAYTFSITRIAHYIKCIMRDNIGSSADKDYINNTLQSWLSQYVTTVVNPDDRTLRHYPFKAAQAVTEEKEGLIGWYSSSITVLPHIQFEGLDVELKMDVRI